jgi:hypothetical protein
MTAANAVLQGLSGIPQVPTAFPEAAEFCGHPLGAIFLMVDISFNFQSVVWSSSSGMFSARVRLSAARSAGHRRLLLEFAAASTQP